MTALMIRRSDVPNYLHHSELYLSLSEDNDGEIAVPEDCLKPDAVVADAASFRHLLSTLRFWIVPDILDEVFECARTRIFFESVACEFYADLSYLKVLQDFKLKRDELHTAVSAGNLVTVKYLFEKAFTKDNLATILGRTDNPYTAEAAHKGHVDCLAYIHSVGCGWGPNVTQSAACAGHVDCLKYTHENGCEWDAAQMAEWAWRGGNVDCLKYVIEHGCPLRNNQVPMELIRKDNIQCVQYLREKGASWPINAMTEALQRDSVKCVAHMLSTGQRFYADFITKVTTEECLQVIHDSGFVWDEGCGARLAFAGNVSLLKYLHKLGCPCGERTWQEAVRKKHTNVLLYIHSTGYELTTAHAAYAAGFSLKMLEFHHSLGCPWDETTVTAAIERSQLDCVVFAVDNGCVAALDVCRVVGEKGYLQTLRYLHDKGYQLYRFNVTDGNKKCAEYVEAHLGSSNISVSSSSSKCGIM